MSTHLREMLRSYQVAAIDQVRAELGAGRSRVLVCMPTGSGKTVFFAALAEGAIAKGSRGIFVAHRREIIVQTYRKLVGCTCREGYDHDDVTLFGSRRDPECLAWGLNPSLVGIVMANDKRRRPGAPIQVCSIDTLRNKIARGYLPPADFIGIDETHRCLAKSYVDLLEKYPPDTNVIGLTATPVRADGRPLGDIYKALVQPVTVQELVALKFLVAPVVYTVPDNKLPDLSDVRVRGGDYNEKDLAEAVNQRELVGDIVEHWKQRANGRRTVCFAASVEHSIAVVAQFRSAGVRAEHLDGTTPTDERDAMLARLERGELDVISNYGVLTEGWDQPAVKCCILARPTKHAGLYLQMAGRILRPWQNTEALILDHAGSVREHGFPQDVREWSLEGKKKKSASDPGPSGKNCPECFMMVPTASRTCPGCGYAWPEPERIPEQREGELVHLEPTTEVQRRAFYDGLVELWQETSFAPGWVAHKFKERFGVWPPSSWPAPGESPPNLDATDEEKVAMLIAIQSEYRARPEPKSPKWIGVRFLKAFAEWPSRKIINMAAKASRARGAA